MGAAEKVYGKLVERAFAAAALVGTLAGVADDDRKGSPETAPSLSSEPLLGFTDAGSAAGEEAAAFWPAGNVVGAAVKV